MIPRLLLSWQVKHFWFEDLFFSIILFILVLHFICCFACHFPNSFFFLVAFIFSLFTAFSFLLTSVFLYLCSLFRASVGKNYLLKKSLKEFIYLKRPCVSGTITVFVVVVRWYIEDKFFWFNMMTIVDFFAEQLSHRWSWLVFGFFGIHFILRCVQN